MKKISKKLTEEQKEILFEKGTESPFTGVLLNNKEKGMYSCVNCGAQLFKSDAKFDSGTGWPSFDDAIGGAIEFEEDNSFGKRIEVKCKNCGSHLGHIFENEGFTKKNKRYCINSACLVFQK